MQLYRFSPIKSAEEGFESLEYIDLKLKELSTLTLGESQPINTLKIFAHYEDEFLFLKGWVNTLGKNDGTSTPSYYVKTSKPTQVNDDLIDYIGIRTPDPYRSQVGCGDYVVDDYEAFKEKHLGNLPYLREIDHPTYEMLELFHPDIDVLGYIVKN